MPVSDVMEVLSGLKGYLIPLVPVVAFVVILIMVNRVGRSRQRKRHEAFRAAAQRLGLEFAAPGRLPTSFAGGPAGVATATTVPFLISGRFQGVPVWLTERSGRRSGGRTAWFTADHGGDFPLTIFVPLDSGPYAAFRKNASAWQMQGQGITVLEFPGDALGERFAKGYSVLASDAAFGRALCSPNLMTYLLEHHGLEISLLGNTLRLTCRRGLTPDSIATNLTHLVALCNLLPTAPMAEHLASGERPA